MHGAPGNLGDPKRSLENISTTMQNQCHNRVIVTTGLLNGSFKDQSERGKSEQHTKNRIIAWPTWGLGQTSVKSGQLMKKRIIVTKRLFSRQDYCIVHMTTATSQGGVWTIHEKQTRKSVPRSSRQLEHTKIS